ncbi:hypothetical protein ACJA28_00890 [Mesomycoplasma moatsii]|uniref:hypothetical protein n=1 Tax=Mesomycoplasma moatsii TaxID=171287 RepID=UPI0003B40764
MKQTNFQGFNLVPKEEQICISAGSGIGAAIAATTSAITSGVSGLVSVADDISNTVIKNKIIAKMDDVQKGEIEIGKDGQIRLKWDSVSSSNGINSTIVF